MASYWYAVQVLSHMWKWHDICMPTKVQLLKAVVLSVATYDCEGWARQRTTFAFQPSAISITVLLLFDCVITAYFWIKVCHVPSTRSAEYSVIIGKIVFCKKVVCDVTVEADGG